jgi:plastocyanin
MKAAAVAGALACGVLALGGCGSSKGTSSNGTGSSSVKVEGTPPASIHVNTSPKFVPPPAGAPVRSGTVQIAMHNVSLAPDAIRVRAGTTVRWTNYDPLQYNVTSVSGPQTLRSGNFGKGASFQAVLSKPGVIHYLCTNYPTTMNGTIEVVG